MMNPRNSENRNLERGNMIEFDARRGQALSERLAELALNGKQKIMSRRHLVKILKHSRTVTGSLQGLPSQEFRQCPAEFVAE